MVISITKPTGLAQPVVHARAGNPFFYTAGRCSWDPSGLKEVGTCPECRGKKREEEGEKKEGKNQDHMPLV